MVRLLLDPEIVACGDASDVVQDALLEASRRLQKYLANPKMPFHLWLRTSPKTLSPATLAVVGVFGARVAFSNAT